MDKYIRYFNGPIPSIKRLASYRFPGGLVHMPVVIICAFTGIYICGDEARFFLPIYFIVGLYFGRDLAILAHYNFIISVTVWILLVLLLIFKDQLGMLFAIDTFTMSAGISALLLIAFLMYVKLYVDYVLKW